MNSKLKLEELEIVHDKANNRYTMMVEGATARVNYELKNDKMYLVYSEVPLSLRGKGIGKVLVEKTFEKLTQEGHSAVAVCGYVKSVAANSEKWSKIIG
ncbi:GNAT family N-acetyltransferase [Ulvibacter antarcticus]|uniref:N-acetyltransferase domain-containing protein n=1 Tax=Ulvibacter antarcticus TaxID=442714 RepID=A0A3L9YV57_9FLAO|nr:GNAT family N-acetyltransferase [Ulvibacter antarcticus]RMA64403.1 hypothetical protein BXY75_1278 [Ulvibacter antarcticus]